MNELKEYFNDKNIIINKIYKKGNVFFVDIDNKKICLKKNKRKDINDIYKYLRTKDFNNCLDVQRINKYEIYPFVNETFYNDEDKAKEIIYLVSLLHNKTTIYQNITIEKLKDIYERHVDKLLNIREYYDNIVYKNIDLVFLSPSLFLFFKNMSFFYSAIDKSKELIDKWYDIMKNKNSMRMTLNHNNLEINHLIVGDNSYLINWNDSRNDVPVNDLYIFFRKNKNVDIESLFKYYNSRYSLYLEEIIFLFSKLLVPSMLLFDCIEVYNVKNVYEEIEYLKKVFSFISKYDLSKYEDKC